MNDSKNEKKKFLASLSNANSLSIRLCEKYTEKTFMKHYVLNTLKENNNNNNNTIRSLMMK